MWILLIFGFLSIIPAKNVHWKSKFKNTIWKRKFRRPTRFLNPPTKEWPLFQTNDLPSLLHQTLESVTAVKQNCARPPCGFVANQDSEYMFAGKSKISTATLGVKEFLLNLNGPYFWYLSSTIYEWRPEGTLVSPLLDYLNFNLFSPSLKHCTVNLWAGTPGVVTKGHYDEYLNLYFQVKGRKRFKLWSPSKLRNVTLFPFDHPSARHVVHNPLEPDMIIELSPGDVFFLPNFWLHEVESLPTEPSLSINLWCADTSLQSLRQNLQFLHIPFESDWSDQTRLDAILLLEYYFSHANFPVMDYISNMYTLMYCPFKSFPLFTCKDNLNVSSRTTRFEDFAREYVKIIQGIFKSSGIVHIFLVGELFTDLFEWSGFTYFQIFCL